MLKITKLIYEIPNLVLQLFDIINNKLNVIYTKVNYL